MFEEKQPDLFHKKSINKIKVRAPLIISIAIVIVLCVAIIKTLLSIDFSTILLAAGENLEKDAEGHTNFLLMGTGGGIHDGADLTDTIIVVSLDQKKKIASLISIPRDYYVENDIIPDSKINEAYYYAKEHFGNSQEGLDYFKKEIETLSGLQIQYYIKVNFNSFEKIIDALGGIDINVPESIYDPYYPKGETIYFETFSMSKGLQHMDGATALKYVRSRETTSDFDRSKRQHLVMYAIKEKALTTKTILDKDKIQNLLNIVKDNIETNLKVRELLTLGAISGKYSKDSMNSKLIHDNPVDCGGFLYTPPREMYNGAFVLVPAGSGKYIQKYFSLITNNQEALNENLKIQILNGTKEAGIAAEQKQVIQRYCFNVTRFGNAATQDVKKTTIYYKMMPLPKENPDDEIKYYKPYTIDALKRLIPQATESEILPQKYVDLGYDKTADILIEIGQDYASSKDYLEDPFYALYSTIYAVPTTDANTSGATTTPTTDTTTTPATPPLPIQ